MQFGQLKRREFIALFGGAAAWPLSTHAQQPAMPVVGFLNIRLPGADPHLLAAFRRGLQETGYVEGRTSRSNTAGRMARTIDCRNWRLIWFAVRWL